MLGCEVCRAAQHFQEQVAGRLKQAAWPVSTLVQRLAESGDAASSSLVAHGRHPDADHPLYEQDIELPSQLHSLDLLPT